MPKKSIHTINCKCCSGSGKEVDAKQFGLAMSGMRLRAEIGLREMARRLKVSHTYIWQMEQGNSRWPEKLLTKYKIICSPTQITRHSLKDSPKSPNKSSKTT